MLTIDIGEAGLAVTAQLTQDGVAVGSPVSLTESGTVPGLYTAAVPGGTAAGTYAVVFRWDDGSGSGKLYWDGVAEVNPLTLNNQLPNDLSLLAIDGAGAVTAANMRGTDDALLAASYTAPLTTAQTEAAVTAGLTDYGAATASAVAAIPTNPLLTTDTRLNSLDVAISTRLASIDYTAPLSAGQTESAVVAGLGTFGAATAAGVAAIPVNPVLTTDSRLDNLDAAISSRLSAATYLAPLTTAQTEAAVVAGLGTYGAATGGDGFNSSDRTRLLEVWQRNGLDPLNALTSIRSGDVVTETFAGVTLTQSANVAAQTVTVERS